MGFTTGFRYPAGEGYLSYSPPRSDRLWGPPNLQWYQGLFPWGQSSQDKKLTTHLHLAPRLGTRGAILPFPHVPSWHGVELSTGHVFMAWYLVKHRDYFAFTFTFLMDSIV